MLHQNRPPASSALTTLGLFLSLLVVLVLAGVSLSDVAVVRSASLSLLGGWLQSLSPILWAKVSQPLCTASIAPLPLYALLGSGVIGVATGLIGVQRGMTERQQSEVSLQQLRQELEKTQQQTIALQQSEERYRQLSEGMPALICQFLPDSTLIYGNPAYCQYFNYPPEELQGKQFLDLLPDESVRQLVQSSYLSLTPERPSVAYEHAVLHPDGSEGWQRWVDRAFFDGQGRVTHYQSIGLDVTDRRRIENELQEQQARLAIALEAANMGTWEANLITGEEIWSPQSQAIFGFVPGTFDGSREAFFQRVHPDDVEMLQQSGRIAIETGILRDEFRVILPDQTIRWVDALGKVFYDDKGQPTRMVGVDIDITERKLTEVALRESEYRYAQILDSVQDMVFCKDAHSTVIYANRATCNYYGMTLEQLQGMATVPLPDSAHRPQLLQDDQQVFMTGQAVEVLDEPNYRLDGTVCYFHTIKSPIFDTEGQAVQVVGVARDISERKRNEVELREQKELLQTIFDHLPMMVVLYSVTGEVLALNRELEQVIGWAKEDYQTMDIVKECYPDPAEYERAIAHIAAADSTWQDFKVRVRDGRILDTSWTQIRLSDGRSLGIGQDITERKQAEEALQASEQRYRAIVEDQAELILRWTPDRTVRFVNQSYCQFYGVVREDFIDQDFLITVSPLIREWLQAELATMVRSLTPEHPTSFLENWVIDAAGQSHYYHFSDLGIFDPAGQLVEIQTVGYDITDRKRAEDALQESETRFRQLAENIQEVFWLTDLDLTRILYISPAYETVWGRTCASLYDNLTSFTEAIHPEDREQVLMTIQQHRYQGWDQEYRITQPDGSLRWIWEQAFPVPDADGQIRRVAGICQDISDRKQAELEIRQLNDALEQQNRNLEFLVEQRTAELMQRTIQLEASNQELESFSYSVSHDLRAPLRHIHGFVNALTQRLEGEGALADPKVSHYLRVIETSSQKMALLIDGLLTLSRIGRKPMEYKPISLRALVDEAIILAQSGSTSTGSTEFVIGALPTVHGDATLLQQVLTNLISNAVKFSRNHPKPRIEIDSLPGGTIRIRDNGVGFQMEYTDKLFGAFQRLHNQAAFEGTGIGLAIVQRIIHRHGGRIWAESLPDQGATFYFSIGDFPLADRTQN